MYSGSLEGGYNFLAKDWKVLPFLSLSYIYLDEQGFEETGAGGMDLSVDDRQTGSLTSQLGLRLARECSLEEGGSLIPEVSAAWLHDFAIDDRLITASFVGSPEAAFTVTSRKPEENGIVVGAGITFLNKGGFTASLRYSGEVREDYQSHGLYGLLRYDF